MSWIYLGAAILLEVAGITSMKLSRGFSEPLPSIAVPLFYMFSAVAVILALKKLDLSTTYAIWSVVAESARVGVPGRVGPVEPLLDLLDLTGD